MQINPNQDNGAITLKPNKFRPGYYIADTLADRDALRFLGFSGSLPESQVDALLHKASEYGFDIRTIL